LTRPRTDRARPTLSGEIFRFLVVGGTNTLCTAVAFYLLMSVVPSRLAFTLAYFGGLTFVVLATPRLVFGSSAGIGQRLLLAGWYIFVYLVGVATIPMVKQISEARVVVVLGTLLVTASLGFVGARLLLHGR
jgi:putative flippase GtrA